MSVKAITIKLIVIIVFLFQLSSIKDLFYAAGKKQLVSDFSHANIFVIKNCFHLIVASKLLFVASLQINEVCMKDLI